MSACLISTVCQGCRSNLETAEVQEHYLQDGGLPHNLQSPVHHREAIQDAGLRYLFVESNVIAEGSASGGVDGRMYNRAVRLHKLVYEALMILAWKTSFHGWRKTMQEMLTTWMKHRRVLPAFTAMSLRDPPKRYLTMNHVHAL